MARPTKEGPCESPQVTLRGRPLAAVKAIAGVEQCDLPEAIRKALGMWIGSEEGKKRLLEEFGYRATSPVVSLESRRRAEDGA